MCIVFKQKTVEELVAEKSVGMTDNQKSEYWYELTQNIFSLLGKEDITLLTLANTDWFKLAQAQYPTLEQFDFADSQFWTLSLADLQRVLSRDWTNKIPYVANHFDCDKFANELYAHFCLYYGVNSVVPVWGQTTSGYHGFNLVVVQDAGQWVARLVEPQSDNIFIDQGPLGKYEPHTIEERLGVKRIAA